MAHAMALEPRIFFSVKCIPKNSMVCILKILLRSPLFTCSDSMHPQQGDITETRIRECLLTLLIVSVRVVQQSSRSYIRMNETTISKARAQPLASFMRL